MKKARIDCGGWWVTAHRDAENDIIIDHEYNPRKDRHAHFPKSKVGKIVETILRVLDKDGYTDRVEWLAQDLSETEKSLVPYCLTIKKRGSTPYSEEDIELSLAAPSTVCMFTCIPVRQIKAFIEMIEVI